MDIGGGEVGYGVVPTPAMILNGAIDYRRGWLSASATGSTYRFENTSASSALGSALIMLRTPPRSGLSGELLTFGSTSNHHDFYRARRLEGRAGVSWVGDLADATLRYGRARVVHDGIGLTTSRIEVEASGAVGPATLTLFGSRASFSDRMSVVRDTTYVIAGFPFRSRYNTEMSVSRAYTDAEARLRWALRSTVWSVALGARRGDAMTSSEHWQRVNLTVPLSSGIALIASGGRRPAVPEERLPSGAFAVLGVQLSFQSGQQPLTQRSMDGRDTPRFVALDVGGGKRSISLIGLVAKEVEIMADFTDWEPVQLALLGERVWHITLPIAPGAHRISIRVDGQRWMPPPGLPVTADEFMGTVGMLLIE